jgi:mediator of RNA polymerase II transcription subunit 7
MDDPQRPRTPEDEDIKLNYFPDPPPFYKHFTSENLARLKDIETEAAPGDDDTNLPTSTPATKLSAEQILALPTELRYLIPPEPPADDAEFHVFGTVESAKGANNFMKNMDYIADQLRYQDVIHDWTYEQLYPSASTEPATDHSSAQQPTANNSASLDRQNYLFRFLRSILLSYISLLGVVAANPTSEQKEQKLKDIMTLVANMHALINEYRPHQARQTLIAKMEEQVRKKREEVESVRRIGEKVREVLAGFAGVDSENKPSYGGEETAVGDGTRVGEEDIRRAQSGMWEAVNEVVA